MTENIQDVMPSKASMNRISQFVESVLDNREAHLLATLAIKNWAKTVPTGVPEGFSKIEEWLQTFDCRLNVQDNQKVIEHASKVAKKPAVDQSTSVVRPNLPFPAPKRKRNENDEDEDTRSTKIDSASGKNAPTNLNSTDIMNANTNISDSEEDLNSAGSSDTDEEPSLVILHTEHPDAIVKHDPNGRMQWTDALDEQLREAVRQHKDTSWAKVAECMGQGISGFQCRNRWNHTLGQLVLGRTQGAPWTEEDLNALPTLVAQHTIASYWSEPCQTMTQPRVDWKAIGTLLNRVPRTCWQKWQSVCASQMKLGAFTVEEDVLIEHTVQKNGGASGQGQGVSLWAELEKDLGRPRRTIAKRWRNVLCKRAASIIL